MEKRYALVLSLLITMLIALNYFYFSVQFSPPREKAVIQRIIDGDTLQLEDGRKIRLININTPEKNQPNYELGMNFLKSYENKSVEIEITGTDKYQRTLARIFAPEYLNLELVRKGYAAKFLVDEAELTLFVEAEEDAIENALGIWIRSPSYGCIETTIEKKQEKVLLTNRCNNLNIGGWILKDESTKLYRFPLVQGESITLHSTHGKDNATDLFWNSTQNVWNDERDTLYLYDENWSIVHHHTYGY